MLPLLGRFPLLWAGTNLAQKELSSQKIPGHTWVACHWRQMVRFRFPFTLMMFFRRRIRFLLCPNTMSQA